MRKNCRGVFLQTACVAILCVLGAMGVRADTLDWNNTGTDFNAAGSWANATHPLQIPNTESPSFNDTTAFILPEVTNPTLTSTTATAVHGILFDTAGTGYTLSSTTFAGGFLNQLAIGAGGINANNPTGSNTISASLVLNDNESITQASGGTLNITGPVVLGSGDDTMTTTLTIGSTSGNGTLNFAPSSVAIGNTIALVTNVNVTLPAVTLEPAPPFTAGITKSGAATLTLSGASTYNGTTTVNAGTLLATNSSGSATGSGAVAVNNGATLGGSGTIAGATTINAGGRITGGTVGTVNTLSLQNNLTFAGASGNLATYLVDLSGGTSDKLAIGGAMDLGGTFDSISFNGSANGTSSYTLATYSSLIGQFNSVINLPSSYTLLYGSTELDLVPLSAVPEPATWVAGALALGAIGYSQRRRLCFARRVIS